MYTSKELYFCPVYTCSAEFFYDMYRAGSPCPLIVLFVRSIMNTSSYSVPGMGAAFLFDVSTSIQPVRSGGGGALVRYGLDQFTHPEERE